MRAAYYPSPLHKEPIEAHVSADLKLDQIAKHLRATGAYVARIGGRSVDPVFWPFVRSKGEDVVFYGRPGNLKSVLLIAATAAIAVAAGPFGIAAAGTLGFTAGTTAFTLASTVASVAFSAVSGLIVNSLFGPSPANLSQEPVSQSFSIGRTRNQSRPDQSIPLVLGFVTAAPDVMAEQTTYFEDREEYLQAAFCHGYGPLAISNLRLGNTAFGALKGVEKENVGNYQERNHDLYLRDVSPEFFSLALEHNQNVIRTTAPDTRRAYLDFTASGGIYEISKKGKVREYPIDLLVEYRASGDADWIEYDGAYTVVSHKREAVRQSLSIRFSDIGQYDIRVRRLTPAEGDNSKSTYQSDLNWSALKSQQRGNPFDLDKPVGATFARIRATGQLNGPLETLIGDVKSRGKKWDVANQQWVDGQVINNPAEIMRLALQHPANAKPVPDSHINLPALQRWAEYCYDKGWTFNQRRDQVTSWSEVVADICAAGRAVHIFANNQHSVAFDDDVAPVVHHFTPQNSYGFEVEHRYPTELHGLKVQFFDETDDFSRQEMIVYAAGYDESNATLFESIEFPGVTNPVQIWKFGRYYLNELVLRPETLTLRCDWESLDLTYGARVAVSHDVIAVSQCTGRVKSVENDDVTLDASVDMEAGTSYGLTYKLDSGTVVTRPVVNQPGQRSVITLSGAGDLPEDETTFAFGPLETVKEDYRIKRLKRDGEFGAEVTLVNHDPAITSDDAATPDAWTPSITTRQFIDALEETPANGAYSERSELDNGETRSIISLSWSPPTNGRVASYEIVMDDGDGEQSVGRVSGDQTRFEVKDLAPGDYRFDITASFADAPGQSSPLSINVTVLGDRVRFQQPDPPAALTALTGTARNTIRWDIPEETDFKFVEVFASQTADFAQAVKIGASPSDSLPHEALGVNETWHYWARTVTHAEVDNLSDFAGPVSATTGGFGSPLLEDDSILLTHLSEEVTSHIASADAANAADIVSEAAARVAADDANAALIGAETTARVSADDSLATDVSTLFSQSAANAAAITSEASTRATEIAAEASLREALAVIVGSNGSAISTETTARIDADGVLSASIASLTSTVDGNTAAITSEANTRAAADSALSSQISVVEASANGLTVALADEVSARIAADGTITAEKTLTFDVNGRVTGYGFIAGAKFSEFGVRTDRFTVSRPDGSGSKPVFAIGQVDGADQVALNADLHVDGSIIGRHVATETLNSDHIEAGSINADRLQIGTGGNLLSNTDLADGLSGWQAVLSAPSGTNQTTLSVRAPGLSYASPNFPTFFIFQNGTAGNETMELRSLPSVVEGTSVPGVPVAPGQWIEASAHIATANCFADLALTFRDKNGAALTNHVLQTGANLGSGVHDDPDTWPLFWGVRQAPANAAFAQFRVIKRAVIAPAPSSRAAIHKPQVIVSHEHAQTPAPYSPGSITLIEGDRIKTGAVVADKIAAGAVTAEKASFTDLQALNLTVGTIDINGSAVTNPKIEDNAISQLDVLGSVFSASIGNFSAGVWGNYINSIVAIEHAGRLRVDAYVALAYSGNTNTNIRARIVVDDVAPAHSRRNGPAGAPYLDWWTSRNVSPGLSVVRLQLQCDSDVTVVAGNLMSTQYKK